MAGHDIVVIGTSAGGVEALLTLVRALPADLGAAVFVTMHLPSQGPSLMPELLSRAGVLPVHHPTDGMPIAHRQILIAPPDHHLLVTHGHVHVVRGPKENGFRPAVDAMFRTAAHAYGPRVVGMVLTGMLDDGTAGLLAIKRRGGLAVVQDPAEAAYPAMPASAMRYVAVDAVCRIDELAPLLVRLANTPVDDEGASAMSETLDVEVNITAGEQEALQQAGHLGVPVPFACPDCGGVLTEYYDGKLLRFRCQVGHMYSPQSALDGQAAALDRSLWAAYNALGERADMARRLAQEAERLGDATSARRFIHMIEQAEARKEQLRQTLLNDLMPGGIPRHEVGSTES
jgi:two-component system, chemotaxis family, protein-glutamate methylesterase/glutaminase